MSPEQLKQDPSIAHRTDIFSLGAVLYGILCGEKPAYGEKLHEVVDSVLNQKPAEAATVAKCKEPTCSMILPPDVWIKTPTTGSNVWKK